MAKTSITDISISRHDSQYQDTNNKPAKFDLEEVINYRSVRKIRENIKGVFILSYAGKYC